MFNIKTHSAKETLSCGASLAKALKCGDIVILEGELGAGKTTFIKGILQGFGYRRRVLSPSYTLVRQYQVKKMCIHHIDLYRLRSEDMFDVGIDDLLYSKGSLGLIEWGGKLKKRLDTYIAVTFSFLGFNQRKLFFSSKGFEESRLKTIQDVVT